MKWLIVIVGTTGLYYAVGHLAILFPVAVGGVGGVVHFSWCRKHGIHPVYATPRRKYYELRQLKWPD